MSSISQDRFFFWDFLPHLLGWENTTLTGAPVQVGLPPKIGWTLGFVVVFRSSIQELFSPRPRVLTVRVKGICGNPIAFNLAGHGPG